MQDPVDDLCLDPKPSGKFYCQDNVSDMTIGLVTGGDNCGAVSVTFAGCTTNQGDAAETCLYDSQTDRLCLKAAHGGDNVDPDKIGKTYVVSFTATDAEGNTAEFTRDVFVPRKRTKDVPDINDCFKGNVSANNLRGRLLM